jgi:hypothetical protein
MEVWKVCEELPAYEVSNLGRVRRISTGRIMKTSVNSKGYETVCLRHDFQQYTRRVHRLVAAAFYPGDHEGMDVVHLDDDKLNNEASNLEWRTRKDNIHYMYKTGIRNNEYKKRKIRCVETGEEFDSITECSVIMGIGEQSISRCVNNRYLHTRDGYHFEPVE